MVIGIISNQAAQRSQSNVAVANQDVQTSMSRLSSGNRITQAKDDVAGLAVGTILRTNVSTLKAGLTNSAQASSLLGLADGALDNIAQLLQRQKSIASQATSGSLNDAARGYLNQEFTSLTAEINRIAENTNFNNIKLIDGTVGGAKTLNTATQVSSAGFEAKVDGTASAPGHVSAITFGGAFEQKKLIGNLADLSFKVGTGSSANTAKVSVTIGDNAYILDNIAAGAITSLALVKSGTDSITLTIGSFTVADTDASRASLEAALNAGIGRVTVAQTRTVKDTTYTGDGSFTLKSSSASTFDNDVTGVSIGENTSSITIGGEVYTATTPSSIAASGTLEFKSGDNILKFTNGSTAIDLGTAKSRETFEKNLKIGFDIKNGISFQVGVESSDSISVSLKGAKSSDLFKDADGIVKTLAVGSFGDAQTAGDILDLAIGRLAQMRANVGSLQSRFSFASANIRSSIENQDAARSVFLDTDLSTESTDSAQAQVRLQASISVLAQANGLSQSLLKLVG